MVTLKRCLQLLSLCCLLAFAAQAVAATALQIKAARHQLELGQPIWLTLTSDQTAVSLASLDFSPWRHQVVLPRAYDVNLANDDRMQVLRLRVYPLHTGRLILPGLHFLQEITPDLRFTIAPARDANTQMPMHFMYQVSTLQPWQQQQVVVSCHLTLPDQYAVFTQPTAKIDGVQLLPMQVQKQEITQAGRKLTRYTLGWVMLPSRAGKLPVQLPPIQYVQDGVVTRRFYVPPLALSVRPLPAWLPGTIPVGRVRLRHYRLSQSWLSTAVLSQLHLQLRVDGVASALMPNYARQLRSGRQLQFYSAQEHTITTLNATGLHHDLHYTIPLVAKHIGLYRLPEIRLQYFDPDSGTLKTRRLAGQTVMIVNAWLISLLLAVVVWLVIWQGRKLLRYSIRYWQRYRIYQLALRQLQQSNSLIAIRHAMQTMARAEGWHINLSYLQWQARMQTRTALAENLAITELNAADYGGGELNVSAVITDLMQICRQRRLAFS